MLLGFLTVGPHAMLAMAGKTQASVEHATHEIPLPANPALHVHCTVSCVLPAEHVALAVALV